MVKISDLKCVDYSTTDIQYKCYFKVPPESASFLMLGYKYLEWKNSKISNFSKCGGGPEVGPKFVVASAYNAFPSHFKHGGSISLCFDKTKQQVLLSYYEE